MAIWDKTIPALIFAVSSVVFLGVIVWWLIERYGPPLWRGRFDNRMPLTELRDAAVRRGWVFDSQSLDILDLADGLRQAGIDGEVRFWGRANRDKFSALTRREPLDEIKREHWRDYQVEGSSLARITDNLQAASYSPGRGDDWLTGGYADLQVDRPAAMRWLKGQALSFRGRRERRSVPGPGGIIERRAAPLELTRRQVAIGALLLAGVAAVVLVVWQITRNEYGSVKWDWDHAEIGTSGNPTSPYQQVREFHLTGRNITEEELQFDLA